MKIDSTDIYDIIHIRRRPRMHINYKSTDRQLKKPQTHKLKPKWFEKQDKFLTTLQKLEFSYLEK